MGLSEEILEKSPFLISGGEQRKVAIAGIIAMEPDVLILDEPTVGLDPYSKKEILEKIKQYHNKKKNTVIVVSHDINVICKISTKVLVVDKGEIASYNSVDETFSNIEMLNELNIDIPEVTKIFHKIKQKGFNIRTDIYTEEDAKEELIKFLGEGKKC